MGVRNHMVVTPYSNWRGSSGRRPGDSIDLARSRVVFAVGDSVVDVSLANVKMWACDIQWHQFNRQDNRYAE